MHVKDILQIDKLDELICLTFIKMSNTKKGNVMDEQYNDQQNNQELNEAEKKRGNPRGGQKQDSYWGDESLIKEFQDYVKDHGLVKAEVYEGIIKRWLDQQRNGIDTGEYRQSALDFETLLAQIQRMYNESLGARTTLVKAHKEQVDALKTARTAAEAEAAKEKAFRENLEKKLSEAEGARNDANALKDQFKATYEDWKKRAEEALEAKLQAESEKEALAEQCKDMQETIRKMDTDLLKTHTTLEKVSSEKETYAARILSLESELKEEKAGRKADAEIAEKRLKETVQEAVKSTLESAKLDLRAAVAEQRDRDADRLEEERQKHADVIAAMQEKIDLARQKQGEAETERNSAVKLQSEAEAARKNAIMELQSTREALAAAESRIKVIK